MAQSVAMLRYVGRLANNSLYPQEINQFAKVEEMIGLLGDLEKDFLPSFAIANYPASMGYAAGYQSTPEGKETIQRIRSAFVAEKLPHYLNHFSRHIEQNGNKFLCGEEPTIADCYAYPTIRRFRLGTLDYIPTDCLDGHPVILSYLDRFLSIPRVTEWYEAHK